MTKSSRSVAIILVAGLTIARGIRSDPVAADGDPNPIAAAVPNLTGRFADHGDSSGCLIGISTKAREPQNQEVHKIEILQQRNFLTLRSSGTAGLRFIPLDPRRHVNGGPTTASSGVGHWEGNVLVVYMPAPFAPLWSERAPGGSGIVEAFELMDGKYLRYDAWNAAERDFTPPPFSVTLTRCDG